MFKRQSESNVEKNVTNFRILVTISPLNTRHSLSLKSIFIALLSFLFVSSIKAQSFIQSWSRDPQVAIEWYHPSFEGSNYVIMAGVGFLSLNVPLSKELQLKADIPFGYYNTKPYHRDSQFSLCDPYIGIEHYFSTLPLAIDFGIRPGISDNSFSFMNENSNYYRFNADFPETWVLRANLHYLMHQPSGFSFQFLFGSFVTLPAKGYGKDEWFLNYGAHVRYQYRELMVGAGIKGIAVLTDAFETSTTIISNKKTIKKYRLSHQLYFELGGNVQNVTPTLYIAFPFDDYLSGYYDHLNYVVGIRLNVHLPVSN